MVIRHQELAVGRAICTVIELDFLSKGRVKVGDDGFLRHDAGGTRLFRRRKGLAKGDLGCGLRCRRDNLDGSLLRQFHAADQRDRVVEDGIISRLGKGGVRDDAIPVFVLILRESAASDFGMDGEHSLHVRFIQFDQRNDLSVVGLVHVSEADPLAARREGKVVIREEQFAIRRAVCSAVQVHFVAVFLREIGDDGLLRDHALAACLFGNGKALGQRALLLRHGCHHGRGLRFELTDLFTQSFELAILLGEFLARFAIGSLRRLCGRFLLRLLILLAHFSRLLREHRQAEEREDRERQHHCKYHVDGDQRACACRHKISHKSKLSHCSRPPPQQPHRHRILLHPQAVVCRPFSIF